MANKDALEFNKIIQADRDKKKKQDLADKIFSRRSSAPAAGAVGRRPPTGPSSLASRITKPGQIPKPRTPNPIARLQQPPQIKRSTSQPQLNTNRRTQALDAALNGKGGARTPNINEQINIRNARNNGPGFVIKGSATRNREYAVRAQNFAPGTTADDVSSVFSPQPEAVGMISCTVLVTSPTVIVELVYDNQNAAEDVVKMFNGKKADNRVLYVYHSDAPRSAPSQPRASRAPIPVNDDFMEIEAPRQPRYQQTYQAPRPQRAQPDVQDGRYGFGDDTYDDQQQSYSQGGLVSDGMIGRQGGRGRQGGGVGRLFH